MASAFDEGLNLFLQQVLMYKLQDDIPAATNKNFLRYYLKAKGNVPDAVQMLLHYAQWRRDNNIGNLNYELVRQQLETGKICVLPNDNPTCDILVIFASRLHYPRDYPTENFTRSVVYVLEMFMCDEREHSGYVVLNDMRGVGKSNFDFKFSHSVRGLQLCLPILPQKILIYKPPLLFKFVWKVVRPLLTSTVHNLIQVVKSEGELVQYINLNNLLQEYGGKLQEDRLNWLGALQSGGVAGN